MSTQPAAAIYCSQCGKSFAASEITQLAGLTVCATCKPQLLRRMQETGAAAAVRSKGFWIRFVAKLLDGLVLAVVWVPLWFAVALPAYRTMMSQVIPGRPIPPGAMLAYYAATWKFTALVFLINLAYMTFMVKRYGATVGKMAIGARVVPADGGPMSWGRAFGRAIAEILSIFTIYIGYLIAAFHPKKRALHDLIAGTVVVAKNR